MRLKICLLLQVLNGTRKQNISCPCDLRVGVVITAWLFREKPGVRFPGRSNWTQCRQWLAIAVMFYCSCAAHVHSREDESRHRHTLGRNDEDLDLIFSSEYVSYGKVFIPLVILVHGVRIYSYIKVSFYCGF